MCYSFTTSIISYTLGMLSAVFALCTNQIILGMLILFYCQMQLSEAMIWRGLDTNNMNLNKIGTAFGKYLLPTHNIGIGLGILFCAICRDPALRVASVLPLIIGLLFYIVILIYYENARSRSAMTFPANSSCYQKSCQNSGNRLRWPYPHQWYIFSFLISVLFMILFVPSRASKIFLGTSFSLLFLVSYLVHPKSVGSVWCFSTAIFAPLLVLINYFLTRS